MMKVYSGSLRGVCEFVNEHEIRKENIVSLLYIGGEVKLVYFE